MELGVVGTCCACFSRVWQRQLFHERIFHILRMDRGVVFLAGCAFWSRVLEDALSWQIRGCMFGSCFWPCGLSDLNFISTNFLKLFIYFEWMTTLIKRIPKGGQIGLLSKFVGREYTKRKYFFEKKILEFFSKLFVQLGTGI